MTPWRYVLRTVGVCGVLGLSGTFACGTGSAYGAVAPSVASYEIAPDPDPAAAPDRSASTSASASASVSASTSASASASASASSSASAAEPDRAGSVAGEGRQRPGRPEETAAQVEGEDEDGGEDSAYPDGTDEGEDSGSATVGPDASAAGQATESPGQAGLAPATPPSEPGQQTAAQPDRSAEPELQILPLGSGLVLIGLGFGLAFVGLRLRRG
ncbi:hypothetical protein [Streptomyces sp. NPDC002088]|uniref:hypothetical protein n=1 Tax=Streptomyces sp. NPDC002088 TaxID=3154665 RepID=UPI003316F52A